MTPEKLLKYKKQIKQFEDEIQRQTGTLDSLFDSLKESLDLKNDTKQEIIINKVQEQIEAIQKKNEKDQIKLNELLEEIEEETSKWDD